MKLFINSFAYRNGAPMPSSQNVDCRDMSNPHRIAALCPLTGKDERIQEFVARDDLCTVLQEKAMGIITETQTVNFGCFGGRHRSVAMAEMLAARMRLIGHDVTVTHRDLT